MSDFDLGEPTEKSKGLDISPLLRIFQRNLPLIALLTAGMTGVGAYLGQQSAKTYQGGFRILVEPITSQGRSTDPSALSREQALDSNNIDYPTLLQVLQSPEILNKVAAQIRTRDPGNEFKLSQIDADFLIREIIRKNLVIRRIGETQLDSTRLIEVTYKGSRPEAVELVLQELSKGYLRYSLEDRRNRIGGGIEFIEDQLPSLQKRVNTLEVALQDLKQRYSLTNPESEGTGVSQQLQETRSQRLQTERELAEQRSLATRLRNQLGFTPDEAMAAAALSENPQLQSAIGKLKDIDAQIALKSARFTEESPALRSLLEQRRELNQLVQAEINAYGDRVTKVALRPEVRAFQNALRLDLIKQLVATDNSREQLEIRNQSVARAEAALAQRLQEFPAIVRQYNNLQQQLEIATKTLNQFLTQRETLRIEAAQKEVPWEIIAPPEVFKDASGTPVASASVAPRLMLMGLAGGLLLGFLTACILEKLRNVYLSSEDAQGGLGLAGLSTVPHKRGLGQSPELPTVMSREPFAKAFGTLYTNLRFLGAQPVRSVVVTSPSAGDGKTTVAVHLALAAAAMGQRVLLVDTNLRLPEIHTLVDVPNQRGLNEVLSDEGLAWEAVVQPSPLVKNLDVITAGEVSLESARLLASSRMQNLMQKLHAEYDLVIYDTANLSGFADANFLAPATNGLIFVVGLAKTKRPVATRVIEELKKFRMPILGLVTNSPGRGFGNSVRSDYDYAQVSDGQAPLLESLKVFKSSPPSSSSTSTDVSR
jgi:capsular exopolysaccharide synthesis family protein